MTVQSESPELLTFGPNGDCIAELMRERARFLIVGGLAVKAYCPERAIIGADVDLIVDRADANAAIVARIVGQHDFSLIDAKALTRPKVQVPAKRVLYMDLLTLPDGESFDALWNRSTLASLNGSTVRVIGRDDLKRMKQASACDGRAKDTSDLELLRDVYDDQDPST
jgi:hypothetical protein